MSDVVVMIVVNGDRDLPHFRVLMELRNSGHYAGAYLFPGGTREWPEGIVDTLYREVREELGIEILEYEWPHHNGDYRNAQDDALWPFLITSWKGLMPSQVLDTGCPLYWMSLGEVFVRAQPMCQQMLLDLLPMLNLYAMPEATLVHA